MRLHDVVDAYVEHLRTERSRNTRYAYATRVRAYLKTLPEDADLSLFTTQSVRAYKARLRDKQRPRSVNTILAALRSFGDYLVAEGHLDRNPAAEVKTVKLDPPRRDTPTGDQVRRLLDACHRIHRPYRSALASGIVSTFVYAGLRRAELLDLRVSDVDVSDGCIRVRHGKGDKPRTVYPHPDCIAAIHAYLALRPDCDAPQLFLARKGFALGDCGLRTLIRDLNAIAGMPDCAATLPHGLRHACATRLDRNGASLNDIKTFLGHSEPGTTAMYIHADTDRMRQLAYLTGLDAGPVPPPPPPDPAPVPPSNSRPVLRLISGGTDKK